MSDAASLKEVQTTKEQVHQLLTDALAACDVDEVERLTALLDKLERMTETSSPSSVS